MVLGRAATEIAPRPGRGGLAVRVRPLALVSHETPAPGARLPRMAVGEREASPGRHGRDQGAASWFQTRDGTCAHRTLPFGTVVTVTDVATGVSTTCRVADRGPADGTRVIDLSTDTFAKLADPSRGLVEVTIRW